MFTRTRVKLAMWALSIFVLFVISYDVVAALLLGSSLNSMDFVWIAALGVVAVLFLQKWKISYWLAMIVSVLEFFVQGYQLWKFGPTVWAVITETKVYDLMFVQAVVPGIAMLVGMLLSAALFFLLFSSKVQAAFR